MKFQALCATVLLLLITSHMRAGLTHARTPSSLDDPDIHIRTDVPLGTVNEKFLSVAIDTSFFRNHSVLDLLKNHNFLVMLRALKPAYIRVGGTAADLVVFDDKCVPREKKFTKVLELLKDTENSVQNDSILQENSPVFYLCGKEWIQLNQLVSKSSMTLLFDLNVLLRTPQGKWNSENAKNLLTFSQKNNFQVDWQLGNEPNSFFHVFGISISPQQLAEDFRSLSSLLTKYPMYRNSHLVGPDITAPRKPREFMLQPLPYLKDFLATGKEFISAVSWHQYYVNGRNATKEMFMDFSTLDILSREIEAIKSIVSENTNANPPIWISETSSAWGGGAPGLSDCFVATFMWLDKLGVAAKYNISVVVRQNLIGSGHYGLIDMKTMQPNPDYWLSLLYKMTVGQVSFNVTIKNRNPNVRLYAHCPTDLLKRSSDKSIVVFGMNLGNSYFKGSISISEPLDIERFSLTAPKNDVLSKGILLNGQRLKLAQSGEIPVLKPLKYKSKFLALAPYSLAFFLIDGIPTSACA